MSITSFPLQPQQPVGAIVDSHKTGRMHCFVSDAERNLFLLREYASDVIDIREQFPIRKIS